MHYLAIARPLGHRWGGNDYWWLAANYIWLLLIAALLVLAVMFALRLAGRSPVAGTAGGPGHESDPAIKELRLRYARGETTRDEYLRAAADLGAPVPPPETPSPPSPA